jgi:threonine aldolase
MTSRSVELRSDTFTRPTPAMRRAMAEAEVGDDVWNEDPTVHSLESRAAELTGKDAALFLASGTQGNLVGILSHTERAQEIIAGDESHVFRYEVAGTAVVGGLQMRTVSNGTDGRFSAEAIHDAIRGTDIHEPKTGCLCLENTHNRCGGRIIPLSDVTTLSSIAHEHGISVHLDGARIFNASVALGRPLSDLVAPVDSVTFCLSKGLGAPVGSVLCGSEAYVARARRWRKLLGGGMRQAGVLAAAGLHAIENHVDRLAEDHANARLLANGLAHVRGVAIDPSTVQTNIVFFDVSGLGVEPALFLDRLASDGVRLSGAGGRVRAVTSYEVTRADVEYALDAIERVALAPVLSSR